MPPLLIAVDLTEASHNAIALGARLAQGLGDVVVLVHAHEPLPRVPGYVSAQGGDYDDLESHEEERRSRRTQELEGLADGLRGRGLQVQTVVREGEPDDVILEAAREHDVDLLVMGTHGRRGVRRWVLGSVAQTVLHRAERPVLVVPAK